MHACDKYRNNIWYWATVRARAATWEYSSSMQHNREYTKHSLIKNTIQILTIKWDGPNHNKNRNLFRICGQYINTEKKSLQRNLGEEKKILREKIN